MKEDFYYSYLCSKYTRREGDGDDRGASEKVFWETRPRRQHDEPLTHPNWLIQISCNAEENLLNTWSLHRDHKRNLLGILTQDWRKTDTGEERAKGSPNSITQPLAKERSSIWPPHWSSLTYYTRSGQCSLRPLNGSVESRYSNSILFVAPLFLDSEVQLSQSLASSNWECADTTWALNLQIIPHVSGIRKVKDLLQVIE